MGEKKDFGLPACLGGMPVRSLPEVPDARPPDRDAHEALRGPMTAFHTPQGLMTGSLQMMPGARLDEELARWIASEPVYFAAELAHVQAPRLQDPVVVPTRTATAAVAAAFAALDAVADDLGLAHPRPGGEVIVSVLAEPGVLQALRSRRLVPVTVDVDQGSLTIDPRAVEEAITERTVGVVASHQWARMADVDTVGEIARHARLFVLEDCTHALGARRGEEWGAGTLGHAATFATRAGDLLDVGDGGAIVTADPRLGKAAFTYLSDSEGVMAQHVAALLRAQLRRFPDRNALRARVFAELDELSAAEMDGVVMLPRQDGVRVHPTHGQPLGLCRERFGAMTLEQVRTALECELNCRLDRFPRVPSEEVTPIAEALDDSHLVVEHAAGLDPRFPQRFATAVQKTLRHSARIARELRVEEQR